MVPFLNENVWALKSDWKLFTLRMEMSSSFYFGTHSIWILFGLNAPVDQIIMKLSIFFPFSIHHGLNICGTIQRRITSILSKCCVLPWKLTTKLICLHLNVIHRFVVRGFTSMKHSIRMFEWKETLWKPLSLNESFDVVWLWKLFHFYFFICS